MKQFTKWKGTWGFYLAGEGICLGIGYLYHLTFLWMIAACAILLFFLPKWRRNYRKGKAEQRRLSDAQIYMEQLLYAFMRQEKLLAAIGEVLELFPAGKMHDTLQKAVELIRYDYQEENVTEQALKLIEEEYQNERLVLIHRFLYKVETVGGSYEGITTLLLQDLNGWRQRMDHYQKDCKKERRNVRIAIATAMFICMVTTYLLPSKVDISGNALQMASTIILILVLLMVYTKADNKLAVNWLLEGEKRNESRLADKYGQFLAYDEYKEGRKSICMAVISGFAAFLFGLLSMIPIASGCALLGILLLNQHKIGHYLAKKTLTREIEKAFPHWLMELSLLLQIDNVQVSIAKTVSHAPEVLQPALEELMQEIEKNPEAAQPYLDFLQEFERPQIQSAMKMLYALSVGNGGSEKEQLEELIARNQNLMNQAEELAHEDALAGMYLLFLAPALAGGMKLLVDMTIFMLTFFTQASVG